jgi:hypothetical protein
MQPRAICKDLLLPESTGLGSGILLITLGSRLVKSMRKLYKANDDSAKLFFSPVAPFGAQISAHKSDGFPAGPFEIARN